MTRAAPIIIGRFEEPRLILKRAKVEESDQSAAVLWAVKCAQMERYAQWLLWRRAAEQDQKLAAARERLLRPGSDLQLFATSNGRLFDEPIAAQVDALLVALANWRPRPTYPVKVQADGLVLVDRTPRRNRPLVPWKGALKARLRHAGLSGRAANRVVKVVDESAFPAK